MASFNVFKNTEKGKKVGEILAEHDWQVEMICLSKHGLPAAQAVGAVIGETVGSLDDTEKQHVGRWIRDILRDKGWKVAIKGARVAAGNFFTRAAIYRRTANCISEDNPVFLKMRDIIASPEGRATAVAAANAGLPAMAGIDPLLSAALGSNYGKHNMSTATAGDLVAQLMRKLGYKKVIGKEPTLPSHCVARTGQLWVMA